MHCGVVLRDSFAEIDDDMMLLFISKTFGQLIIPLFWQIDTLGSRLLSTSASFEVNKDYECHAIFNRCNRSLAFGCLQLLSLDITLTSAGTTLDCEPLLQNSGNEKFDRTLFMLGVLCRHYLN